ncbi:MAG: sugar transferase [Candidatus ainarchaeum sp.]|nr:sugar transferase [Candidatus ainarchaeum sp.]
MKKIYSDGKIFHSQIRVGKTGPIVITKFRTMRKGSHSNYMAEDTLQNEAREPYATKFGRILRKTKLDELPQVISLLKGDLNFMGIRPISRQHFSKLPNQIKKIYLTIGPGLIGIAYAVPKKERTVEKTNQLILEFYADYIKNKKKAYFKWGLKVLKNVYK